ncbi:MAG: MoaD/ThiS family protein [Planctomycetes bacterium]|nr:MoaD/ThiS family protein [Planctomycetota bacterium]
MQIDVHIPLPLRRYSDDEALVRLEVAGADLGAAFSSLFERHAELGSRILDPKGSIQPYLIVLRGTEPVDREAWAATPLVAGDEIDVVPAVEGGSGREDDDDFDPAFPCVMEAIGHGFFRAWHEIRVDGVLIGRSESRFFGGCDFELEGGGALQLRRHGFWSSTWELRLGDEKGPLLAEARRGFFRQRYEVRVGDREGLLEGQRLFSTRRDYLVGGRVVAFTTHRGLFKRGFLVRARPEVGQTEMFLIGWIAHRARQQQSAAAASSSAGG